MSFSERFRRIKSKEKIIKILDKSTILIIKFKEYTSEKEARITNIKYELKIKLLL
jgi:hypothetical protein